MSGNLSNEVTEAKLNCLLAEYVSVQLIHLSPERQTDRERDLAVEEIGTAAQEEGAIKNLDGTQWYGCSFTHLQSQPPLPIQVVFKSKHTCPCCSSTLLRHIRWGSIYWRCSHCYQEMPIL